MKKILAFSLMLVLMTTLVVAGSAGKGKASQLFLYEKDPETWDIVEGGAFGKMMYKDDSFVFNGHGLLPNTNYALVVFDTDEGYDGDWPGEGPVLASGTSNNGGNIHLIGAIPAEIITGNTRIWLVLDDDADESGVMIGWNPTSYLFENNLI